MEKEMLCCDHRRVMFAAPKSGSGKTLLTCAFLEILKERGYPVSSCKSGPDYIDPLFHRQVLGIPSRNLDTYFTDDKMTRALFAAPRVLPQNCKGGGSTLSKESPEGKVCATQNDKIPEGKLCAAQSDKIPEGKLRATQSDKIPEGKGETKENENAPEYVLIEGAMGLFDGAGGIAPEGSSYDLARVTKTPIVLIVDAKGCGYSVLPLIAGFMQYDKEKLLRGVILNRTSSAMAERLRLSIETEAGIPLLGCFPENKTLQWESRYLGLTLPEEVEDVRGTIRRAAEAFEKTIDVDALLRIMEGAEPLPMTVYSEGSEMPDAEPKMTQAAGSEEAAGNPQSTAQDASAGEAAVRIGVARDEAFCFYYEENFDLLRALGAEIVEFSPVHDARLPEGISALMLGGGYPELLAKELAENVSMKEDIFRAVDGGMPTIAECGGFMYLHKMLRDKEERTWPMVGIFDAECYYTGRSQRFGYVMLQGGDGAFRLDHCPVRGHEFHYFESTDPGEDLEAIKPVIHKRYRAGHVRDTMIAGYPHLYLPSAPAIADAFVEKAIEFRTARNHAGEAEDGSEEV